VLSSVSLELVQINAFKERGALRLDGEHLARERTQQLFVDVLQPDAIVVEIDARQQPPLLGALEQVAHGEQRAQHHPPAELEHHFDVFPHLAAERPAAMQRERERAPHRAAPHVVERVQLVEPAQLRTQLANRPRRLDRGVAHRGAHIVRVGKQQIDEAQREHLVVTRPATNARDSAILTSHVAHPR
jgi:hypothetical protein